MFFKPKSKLAVTCYAFEFFNEIKDAKQMTHFLYEYFFNKYKIELKSFYSFDHKYRDYNVKLTTALHLEEKTKWSDLMTFFMSSEENLDETKTLILKYDMTRPVSITIGILDNYLFDMKDFGSLIYRHKLEFYAYKYSCNTFRNFSSYSSGGSLNRKSITDLPRPRLKREVISRWRKNWDGAEKGLLRDIYSENIVTQKQINNKVGDNSLFEKIQIDDLGRIDQIEKELYYWKLDDMQMEKARKHLYQYDIFV